MVKTELRPTTATLMKPTILDAKLLGIFDMTTVSREHLVAIKNLVHTTPRCKCRLMNKSLSLECDQKCHQNQENIQKMYKVLNKTYRIRTNVRKKLHSLAEASEIVEKPIILPAPCSTCGRSDQPERFHSHPSRTENQKIYIKDVEEKKPIQKPMAMKFRSAKTKLEEEKGKDVKQSPINSRLKTEQSYLKSCSDILKQTPEKSSSGNAEVVSKRKIKIPTKWREVIKKSVQQKKGTVQEEKSKFNDNNNTTESGYKLDNWNPAPVSGGRKRKVVCYLCSQEFGTSTLPAHEAMCIQKYLKQNNDQITNGTNNEKQLDVNDVKSSQMGDNWKLAWEITQASLISCDFCERKFIPARLEAHQRICASKFNKETVKNKTNNFNQPGVLCEYCGKRYGSNSIIIHRTKCVKKGGDSLNEADEVKQDNKENSTIRKPMTPPMVICNICGRNFGTKSIIFHEPQCLKKWKLENEKLLLHIPKSPSVKSNAFEKESEFEYESQESFWRAHQAQLVPCPKCSRTFYPNRLEVHLKGCKGFTKNKKK